MLRLPPRARTGLGLVALLVLAAALRWPFWREALRTPLDGDTSLLALMALHTAQTGTTLWGQPYGSPLEAWLLAPFLALTGPRSLTVHVFYFTLGLLLVPAAFLVARRLEPGIEWHAATLAAAPSAYLLLLSASPPPLYPLELLMCAALLGGALALERRLARGEAVGLALLLWGGLAGLAFWTHLMAASVVATGLAFLACSAGPLRRRLWPALVGLVLGAWPSPSVSTGAWPPAPARPRASSSTCATSCRPCTVPWPACWAATRRCCATTSGTSSGHPCSWP